MKIRIDFVSNSSSCSFIIEDVDNGLQVLKELDILDATEMNDISVQFILPLDVFNTCHMQKYESWRDEHAKEVFCSCQPYELVQLPAEVKKHMVDFKFSCEDCDQHAVLILALMYETLKLAGVSVDNEQSEIDFPCFDNNSIIAKFFNYIKENRK